MVHLHFGIWFKRVTIARTGDAHGHVLHRWPEGIDYGEALSRTAMRAEARRYIVAAYAGLEAQRLVDDAPRAYHGRDDDQNAFEISCRYQVWGRGGGQVGNDAHRAYLETLRRESRRLVHHLQREVEAVAGALLRDKTLTMADADAIVRRLRAEP